VNYILLSIKNTTAKVRFLFELGKCFLKNMAFMSPAIRLFLFFRLLFYVILTSGSCNNAQQPRLFHYNFPIKKPHKRFMRRRAFMLNMKSHPLDRANDLTPPTVAYRD